MPVGIKLLQGFQQEPWLGLVVKGIYDDAPSDDYGAYLMLVLRNNSFKMRKPVKLKRIYIAMSMGDEKKSKYS